MKLMTILLALFGASSTFAADLYCEQALSPTRVQYAAINVWPMLEAQTAIKECTGNGGFQFCIEQGQDDIASANQICGYAMNVQWECQTRQWSDNAGNRVVETQCPRWGVRAKLQLNAQNQGRIACFRGNHVERVWRLGTCY